jgi:hypothetical protein
MCHTSSPSSSTDDATHREPVLMADHSAIEWTDATWNPTTGCTKISPGCSNCYIERTPAFRIAGRRFERGATDLRLHANRLDQPLHWRKPRRVFVNSLSDLFHDERAGHVHRPRVRDDGAVTAAHVPDLDQATAADAGARADVRDAAHGAWRVGVAAAKRLARRQRREPSPPVRAHEVLAPCPSGRQVRQPRTTSRRRRRRTACVVTPWCARLGDRRRRERTRRAASLGAVGTLDCRAVQGREGQCVREAARR